MKQNQILPRGNQVFNFQKTACGSFRGRTKVGKCKTKAIQADLGTFRRIQELFKHI